ncbi:hypothetical protein [Aquibacillus salsiterrae]|uniref:Uncharacterized protein n=1 Tax=Aquibacillus salsiterrae TaxID=2950439 RepID=A0A9X4AEZ2_9BACI|nr:hypothetical protein [Aquibacillus salsiterrae]MDC3417457.1 hypothetical protein [Aquibacillus salsiterrae]
MNNNNFNQNVQGGVSIFKSEQSNNRKSKTIVLLSKIAQGYLISGIFIYALYATAFKYEWLLIVAVGSVLAWVQLYLITAIVQGFYVKHDTISDNNITHQPN